MRTGRRGGARGTRGHLRRHTHYVAHGSGGSGFECYWKEMRSYLDAITQCKVCSHTPKDWLLYDEHRRDRVHPPEPYRSTDVRKVNCVNCIEELLKLLSQKHEINKATGRLA